MAKKIERTLKLQIPAGKANPAPPVGPALGQVGVNIGEFVNQFNEATKEMMGDIIPVIISVYDDRSFDFILKKPPASRMLLKALGKPKGSGKNLVSKVGSITDAQLGEVATAKMDDLNTSDIEQAKKVMAGTARSMGIEIKG